MSEYVIYDGKVYEINENPRAYFDRLYEEGAPVLFAVRRRSAIALHVPVGNRGAYAVVPISESGMLMPDADGMLYASLSHGNSPVSPRAVVIDCLAYRRSFMRARDNMAVMAVKPPRFRRRLFFMREGYYADVTDVDPIVIYSPQEFEAEFIICAEDGFLDGVVDTINVSLFSGGLITDAVAELDRMLSEVRILPDIGDTFVIGKPDRRFVYEASV